VAVVEMVAMETMPIPNAAHAAPVTAHHTDVTSPESEGAIVASAETATDTASAQATNTEAGAHTTAHATTLTAAEAAAAMSAAAPAPSPAIAHQHQQTAPCIHIGVIGIARLR
jgi:hypothetical protein